MLDDLKENNFLAWRITLIFQMVMSSYFFFFESTSRSTGIVSIVRYKLSIHTDRYTCCADSHLQDYRASPLRLKAFRLFQTRNKVAWNIYQPETSIYLFFSKFICHCKRRNKIWKAFRSIDAHKWISVCCKMEKW